jgi:hypothetical protein
VSDDEMDELRSALGEVTVLASLTKAGFDAAEWDDPDPDTVDGIASLLGLLEKSAIEAMAAFRVLDAAAGDAQPAPATPPGEAMSAEDAAIIRRIRTRCPDRRFDGGTDEELLDLFKRNRQVLARSDEDVIAAMTRPR